MSELPEMRIFKIAEIEDGDLIAISLPARVAVANHTYIGSGLREWLDSNGRTKCKVVLVPIESVDQ